MGVICLCAAFWLAGTGQEGWDGFSWRPDC